MTVFAVNRSETETVRLSASLRALPGPRFVEHLVLGGATEDLLHTNGIETPDRVAPRSCSDSTIDDVHGQTAALPPVSWTMLRLAQSDQ